jgi:LacI family transcriptional regulator
MATKRTIIGYSGRTLTAISSRPLGGIIEYCRAHRHIELRDFSVDHRGRVSLDDEPDPPWKGRVDGLIWAQGFKGDPADALDYFRRGEAPVVGVTSDLIDPELPTVFLDPVSVARLAAEELLHFGCRSLVFVGVGVSMASPLREAAFREALNERDGRCHAVTLPDTFLGAAEAIYDREALADHPFYERLAEPLRHAERPVGVWTLNDPLARAMVNVAELAGLRVPDDVAIVGVDDTPDAFDRHPTITSTCTPGEEIGWKAMELMESLIAGTEAPREPVLVPATEIVRRETTGAKEGPDDVALALDVLRRRATSGATIQELIAALPVSRRTLERAFRKRLGRTLSHEMQLVRLAAARNLLRNTDFTVEYIAWRTGFAHQAALSNFFRRQTGMWPSQYRAQTPPDDEGEAGSTV